MTRVCALTKQSAQKFYKLALTVFATTILLANTATVHAITHLAARGETVDTGALGGQLLHAGVGMLVLLATAVLGIYKPKGLTPYGWRKQHLQAGRPPKLATTPR